MLGFLLVVTDVHLSKLGKLMESIFNTSQYNWERKNIGEG